MKHWFNRLLQTFDYDNTDCLLASLAPSLKYGFSKYLLLISIVWVPIDKWFGMDAAAVVALVIVFFFELLSGLLASRIRNEPLSSMKLSRFTLKMACYLVIISATYLMAESFKNHGKDVPAWAFDWLHNLLISQIMLENVVSIKENVNTMRGVAKDDFLNKLQDKFYTFFKL